jgi:SAM-dependent methyltransferase
VLMTYAAGPQHRKHQTTGSHRLPWPGDDQNEIECLLRDPANPASAPHLSSRASLLNYVRFADEVRGFLTSGSHVLDWGCGLGQVSWLLARRNLVVTSFDIKRFPPNSLAIDGDQVVIGDDPVLLPFPSASFDAVLSCGVLEHVSDERASLQEIKRVLKPNGFFFIYQLPQRYAYTELINRWRAGRWHHPRRYTPRSIRARLDTAGFRLLQQRRANFLPKNLTGLPTAERRAYNRIAYLVDCLDLRLSKVPFLNLLCHSIEIIVVSEGVSGGE